MSGLISNIQRFSVDDGPGIRTTIFLKGCNLNCAWCHNPECIDDKVQIKHDSSVCIGCGECVHSCKTNSIELKNNEIVIDRETCIGCGECEKACLYHANVLEGEIWSSEDLMLNLLRDKPFYEQSNGGVTISGGEPYLQKEFLKEILLDLHNMKINIAIDTAGNIPWETIKETLPYIDIVLFDIKLFSEAKHKKYTGVSNVKILENIIKLSSGYDVDIYIRIPVISGINDDIEEMSLIAEFIGNLNNIKEIEFLPYHNYGIAKYSTLGMTYSLHDTRVPDESKMHELRRLFKSFNLNVM